MRRTVISAAVISAIINVHPAAQAMSSSWVAQDRYGAGAEHLEDTQQPFMNAVRQKLTQRRFADLDKMAEEVLRTKARFPGGDWKLYRFFGAVGRLRGGIGDLSNHSITRSTNANAQPVSGGPDVSSDSTWEAHIALLRSWRQERPKSVAAAIALGDALIGYAWKARGSGYADTVTAEGRRLFKERLHDAEVVLTDGKRLSAKNPHWYCLELIRA